MKYLNNMLFKGLQSIEFIALCLILISNVFCTSVVAENEQVVIEPNNFILSFLSLALVFIVIFLLSKIIDRPKDAYFLVITQLIYGVLLLLWIHISKVVPFTDQGYVYQAALNFNQGNYEGFAMGGYLYQYNHQIPLTFMFSLFLKIFGGGFKSLQIIIGLCSIGVNLGIYKLTQELFNEKAARISIIISMMFAPTFLLTTYVYGDIIGLCFSIWAIYFTIRYGREGSIKHALYSNILIGIAMLFRYNMVIVLIAMIIYVLLKTQPKRLLIALILLASLGYGYGVKKYAAFRTGRGLDGGIPAVLYVNMGLEEGPRAYGWYNRSTVKNYNSVNGDSEKAKELGLELINGRVSYMGSHIPYTLRFFHAKFITTWAEPTFESLFFTLPHNQSREVAAYYKSNEFLNSLYYGPLSRYALLYCKGFALFIIIGAVLCSFLNRKKLSPEYAFLLLSLVGTLVFHLFWETKSRYVFPAFVLLFPPAAGLWANSINSLPGILVLIRKKTI